MGHSTAEHRNSQTTVPFLEMNTSVFVCLLAGALLLVALQPASAGEQLMHGTFKYHGRGFRYTLSKVSPDEPRTPGLRLKRSFFKPQDNDDDLDDYVSSIELDDDQQPGPDAVGIAAGVV